MKILEIPGILFLELSARFGTGEESTVSNRGLCYKVVGLGEDMGGAVGFHVSDRDESSVFVVWDRVPGGKDDVFEPEPLVEIKAEPVSTGTWAYGKGRQMFDSLSARFPLHVVDLRHLTFSVAAFALNRSSELVLSPECEKSAFWEFERRSELDAESSD